MELQPFILLGKKKKRKKKSVLLLKEYLQKNLELTWPTVARVIVSMVLTSGVVVAWL